VDALKEGRNEACWKKPGRLAGKGLGKMTEEGSGKLTKYVNKVGEEG